MPGCQETVSVKIAAFGSQVAEPGGQVLEPPSQEVDHHALLLYRTAHRQQASAQQATSPTTTAGKAKSR